MKRLLVHVEGQTEEAFVNELLAPHLAGFGFASVSARLVGNARLRGRRGGVRGWAETRRDLVRHLREDSSCVAALMIETAPSKRIEAVAPRFQKLLHGVRAARAAGLERMRGECPRFADGLARVERAGK